MHFTLIKLIVVKRKAKPSLSITIQISTIIIPILIYIKDIHYLNFFYLREYMFWV